MGVQAEGAGWDVYDARNLGRGIHIIPTLDICAHELSTDCACGVSMDYENGTHIFTHHSADGREKTH